MKPSPNSDLVSGFTMAKCSGSSLSCLQKGRKGDGCSSSIFVGVGCDGGLLLVRQGVPSVSPGCGSGAVTEVQAGSPSRSGGSSSPERSSPHSSANQPGK